MPDDQWLNWQEYIHSVLELAKSFERIAAYRLLDYEDQEDPLDALTAAGVSAVYAGD